MSEIQLPQTEVSMFPTKAETKVETASTLGFIPNIKLIQNTGDEVGQPGVSPGDYYFNKVSLGKKLKVVVFFRRWHAMVFEHKVKKLESYVFESPVFEEIRNTKSQYPAIRSGWGHDFLVWLVEQRQFATFFPNAPSARECGKVMTAHLKPEKDRDNDDLPVEHTNTFELFSELTKWPNGNSAWVPKFTPLKPDPKEWPSSEQLDPMLKMFLAPVEAEMANPTEVADEDDDR